MPQQQPHQQQQQIHHHQQQQISAAKLYQQSALNSSTEQLFLKIGIINAILILNNICGLGNLALAMEDWDKAIIAFESAIKNNPSSIQGYYFLGSALHQQKQYIQAMEVYHRLLSLLQNINPAMVKIDLNGIKGEVWASIGHCALLLDDLARAFSSFQQALQISGSPRNSTLWFSIGLLYDRYGADELAREAFLITLRYEREGAAPDRPPTAREREVYYRLGQIYKNLKKWDMALECLEFAMKHPPAGLLRDDVYYYIAVSYGLRGDIETARPILEHIAGKVVHGAIIPPNHPVYCSASTKNKAQISLGWFEARDSSCDLGISIVNAAIEDSPSDSFGWYALGRIHMLTKDFTKAYDAYQQAVYRDGTNAAFWNSIGILYFEIGQFRDALDAFSRSIHLAPFVADTWWNLGVLYETSHKQYEDALDAYNRAAELDGTCQRIQERIACLREKKLGETPVPRPVEYCPMPFFSRPVILGDTSIPTQRPSIQQQSMPIQAVEQKPASLQQSRAAHPGTFARTMIGGFSLPQPSGGFPHQGQPQMATSGIGPRPYYVRPPTR